MYKDKHLIYVAHPYNGTTGTGEEQIQNMLMNDRQVKQMAEQFPDCIMISPLWAFGRMSGRLEEYVVLNQYCFGLLARCDELWLTGNWRKSKGCLAELDLALELGKPVYVRIDTEDNFYLQQYQPLGKELG